MVLVHLGSEFNLLVADWGHKLKLNSIEQPAICRSERLGQLQDEILKQVEGDS